MGLFEKLFGKKDKEKAPLEEFMRIEEKHGERNERKSRELYEEGLKLSEKEEYEEAIKYFDKAISLDKHLKEAWLEKGFAYLHLSNSDNEFADFALKSFNTVLELDPKCEDALWGKFRTYMEKDMYIEALEVNDQLLELTPDDKAVITNRKGLLHLFFSSGITRAYELKYGSEALKKLKIEYEKYLQE